MNEELPNAKKTIWIPVFLMTVGTGSLLTALDVVPEIDWIWTLGLGTMGILILALGGLNKFTAVAGPMFLSASGLSMLRQTGHITLNVEVPILVIVLGVLSLIAHSKRIPVPSWYITNPKSRDSDKSHSNQEE